MADDSPKNVIEVDPSVADAIKKLAASTGLSSKDIVGKLFTMQLKETKETPEEKMKNVFNTTGAVDGQSTGGKASIIDKMMEMQALSKFTDNKDTLFDKDFLKMMWQMQMMSQMMPNMQQQKEGSSLRETIELAKLIGGDGKDSKEMLELVKEIQKQKDDQLRDMQKTQMEQIKELLQEKRISEIEKKQEAQLKSVENKVGMFSASMVDKLNDLEVAIANKPQVGGMSEEIQKYIAFKKTMVTLAEAEGLTKKDITDSSGKVNWAKLSDKLIDTAGQIGQAFAQRQPPQRDVQPMNVPDVDIMQPEVPVEEVAEVSEGLQQAGATTSSIGLPGQRYKKQEERVAPQVLGAIPEAPGIGDEVEVLTPEEVEEMRAAPSPALEVVEEAPIVEPDVEVLPSGYWRDKRGMLRQDGRAGVIGRKEEGAILQSLHTKAEQEQQ